MTNIFFTKAEAAKFLGIELKSLSSAIKHKRGPAYIMPTSRKMLFLADDLVAWRATWKRVDHSQNNNQA